MSGYATYIDCPKCNHPNKSHGTTRGTNNESPFTGKCFRCGRCQHGYVYNITTHAIRDMVYQHAPIDCPKCQHPNKPCGFGLHRAYYECDQCLYKYVRDTKTGKIRPNSAQIKNRKLFQRKVK